MTTDQATLPVRPVRIQARKGMAAWLWVCDVCPHCGAPDHKNARRERTEYHFTDGFLQDLQGEATHCHACKQSLRVVPVVMLHDQDETRRFAAIFSEEFVLS